MTDRQRYNKALEQYNILKDINCSHDLVMELNKQHRLKELEATIKHYSILLGINDEGTESIHNQ